jgi:hypothetical protein
MCPDQDAVVDRCKGLLRAALVPGYDPYDALAGTTVPRFVRRSTLLRQMTIQLRKRSATDLSSLMGVRPFVMAKALGCFLAAAARVESVGAGGANFGSEVFRVLVERARSRKAEGWGYEFDVQTRWGYYPANSPNLIATVFVARGFLEWWLVTGSEEAEALVLDACEFLLDVMYRGRGSGRAFFYTADSDVLIHNANVLGAALLAAAGRVLGRPEWVAIGREAVDVTLEAQRPDGTWAYGEASGLEWSDSFHTAYVLEGLHLVSLASSAADERLSAAIELGARVWMSCCFGADGTPFYYTDATGPHDIHSAATAIDVLSRMEKPERRSLELACRTYRWTERNLLDDETGLTYYRRKDAARVDKRNFRRWGDAHFALGCSALLTRLEGRHCPIEAALERSHE